MPAPKSGSAADDFGGLRSDPSVLDVTQRSSGSGGSGPSLAVMGAVGAGAFLLTVLLGSLFIFGGDEEDAPLTSAEASAFLREIEPIDAADRTKQQWRTLARSYGAVDRKDDALEAWLTASKLGAIDEEGIDYCIAQLSDPFFGDRAQKALAGMPPQSGVDLALEAALESESISTRRGALRVMDRRGSAQVAHHVDVAIRDMLTAPECGQRKAGLLRLKDIAGGEDRARAVQAIQKVKDGAKTKQVSCMLPYLERAQDTILKR